MRVIVTGREGQVARSLIERVGATGDQVVPVGRPEFDLSGSESAIVEALASTQPDVIVSAAAYTAVDRAETEPEEAFRINAAGVGAVTKAARQLGVPLIHLSTDYVFDGLKTTPYDERDRTSPATVYGASKLAGEHEVLEHHDDVAILRTAWVYSPFGANFVKSMLRIAESREEVGVVADQVGNPTSALDIADGILAVAANLTGGSDPSHRGVFHMTGSGEASWADFAETIFQFSEELGGISARVRRIASKEYPTPAKRPANSRLDCTKLNHGHSIRLPDWRESTAFVVSRLIDIDQGNRNK